MSKFECKKCGQCCRFLSRSRELENLTGKKGPLYILPGIEQTWLSLYEWELEDFLAAGRELSREIKITPALIAIDQLTNTPLGIVWQLAREKCPFLNESNLCEVYERRPLICRLFPVRRTGLFLKNSALRYEDLFLNCRHLSPEQMPISSVMEGEEFFKSMSGFFGEIYAYSYHQEKIQMMLIELLKQLESDNTIKLARGRPIRYVQNLVDRKGTTGLFKFLKEKKSMRVDIEKLLKNYSLSREELIAHLKRKID